MNTKLAQIAQEQAFKFYHGNIMGVKSNLNNIAEVMLDKGCTMDMLDGCWCAAFVYYCTILAGYKVCMKYPGWVLAWEEWAKSDENRL